MTDNKGEHHAPTVDTAAQTEVQTPPMTEREALYRCITSMWEYALSPLPDDSLLAIIESCREFGEYDHDYLKKWIEEVEASRSSQRQERRDVARLAHVTEVQDHLFFALELAHRFSPNPAIRNRIEDETRAIRDQWNKQAAAPDKKRGYAGMADRAQATCDAYVKLLNELYEMRPSDETTPNGNTAASIEQNRPTLTQADLKRIKEILSTTPVILSDFAGDAKEVVGEIRDNASKAADNTVAIIDELAAWREWIENGGKSGIKKNDTRTQLLKDMRDSIWDKWQRYKDGDADCELPNGKLRTAKRTYEEFYEKYGTAIVYTSRKDGKMWTLKQLCRNIDELKTAIDSANKSAKRSAKKVPKRKTDKKIR